MIVLHIAAGDGEGGADRAAVNLHRSLLQAGVQSMMLVGKSQGGLESVQEAHQSSNLSKAALEDYFIWSQRTALSNTYFSLNFPGSMRLDEEVILKADIVNLHWVAGLISASTLCRLAELGKPILWTLHDARPLTGGCHFPASCTNYKSTCTACPQLLWNSGEWIEQGRIMLQQALEAAQVHFVAPSSWMREFVETATSSRNRKVTTIPNGVDTGLFAPACRTTARKELGLRENALYILMASHHVTEKRKGFQEALEILKQLKNLVFLRDLVNDGSLRILVCGRGAESLVMHGWEVDKVGFLPQESMPLLYNAADLLLFTPTEDNLPNVVMEAMSCGITVTAHDLPGVRDMFGSEDPAGIFLPLNNSCLSAMRIGEVVINEAVRSEIGGRARMRILEHFRLSKQASSYIQLYGSLLEHKSYNISHAPPVTSEQEIDAIMASLMLRSKELLCERDHALQGLGSRWARLGRRLGLIA